MSGPEKFHSVFARNCEIRRIDRELAASFLNACHLYGDCAAAYRYGLFVSRHAPNQTDSGSRNPQKDV